MLHKAWNSKGEMPYCFPRSSIKFQGHTGQNITDFDPNWAFPDYRPVAAFKSLFSSVSLKCASMGLTDNKLSDCPRTSESTLSQQIGVSLCLGNFHVHGVLISNHFEFTCGQYQHKLRVNTQTQYLYDTQIKRSQTHGKHININAKVNTPCAQHGIQYFEHK